ncbi:MAG: type II toxin-antitoxin system prevent-host-death family antitoxin [Nitrospirota bacterium]
MKTATAKDLRHKTAALLREVRRGKRIGITYRGRTVAELVPHEPVKEKPFEPIGFGMWRDRKDLRDVERWMTRLRKPRYTR